VKLDNMLIHDKVLGNYEIVDESLSDIVGYLLDANIVEASSLSVLESSVS
jgi:hypothetical protein